MARSGIIYGDSGVTKSTACKHFSHYIYEKTGKGSLLLSMDGGGWGPMQPEIDAGVILPYRCNSQVPLPVLRKISQGYWPEDSGETEISRTNLRKIDWQKFGGVIIEGVTSISQAIMRHLADTARKTGEDPVNPFPQNVIVEGQIVQEVFSGNNRAHYNFTQNQLYALISNLNAFPCEYVLFTGLESRAEEDDRTPIYGPQIAGKKATALVPSWVGDCIHAQGFAVKRDVKVPDPADPKKEMLTTVVETVVRMYFMKHPDAVTGINYPAKPRVSPEAIPQLLKEYPGGYFEPGLSEGFDKYLHTIDRLNQGQADAVAEWRRKVDERFGRGGTGASVTTPTAPSTK